MKKMSYLLQIATDERPRHLYFWQTDGGLVGTLSELQKTWFTELPSVTIS